MLSGIREEMRKKSVPELSEGLDKLDIAISFLRSVGAESNGLLSSFMTDMLKIDQPLPSQKVS